MTPFVHQIDITNEDQIVEHFQNIPDITEYILESEVYPFRALSETLETLQNSLNNGHLDVSKREDYQRTIFKIESVLSTRLDYVNSMIGNLLGRDSFDLDEEEVALEEASTQEILFHIDLMKDVAHAPAIQYEDYTAALRKLIKTLKFRFNKGLEIYRALHNITFEELADQHDTFPRATLEEQKNFLEDALAMTRSHIPVKPAQIHQLKETLLKILEAMGIRILQVKAVHFRTEYFAILARIEDLIMGLELEFGQKIGTRFAEMLPEYIADHWSFDVIQHNRRLIELLIDHMEDATLLEDLYKVLINLITAETVQTQRKHKKLANAAGQDIQEFQYVENEENALLVHMDKFRSLDIAEQARELIKLSLYGLCEYISKFSLDELSKYPIGILKSTEKILKDLDQHRLRESEAQGIRNFSEYATTLRQIEESLFRSDSSQEKYNFVDIYKETDYTVEGITYCAFNDIILRLIQNITEACFMVDSDDKKMSEGRLEELRITIAERYKTEWIRQNQLWQESEQQAMEALAEEIA
ncbi:hypothetical protein GF339_01925 [candidate division KSB3 bacterium]|uniref:Uncharacterized protein n=1 Tax=candidate division KSB3 bacterium TaxID=2044937 RepID=A0A9D5Q437_9BACT|nr:hypothetical protein [candidate division KSB3 bacterium]MBD3323309.1 hypothetical protein [candidate division KSB3 bacterium]